MPTWPVVLAVAVFGALYVGYMLWMSGPNGPRQIRKAIAGWDGKLLGAQVLDYSSLRHERYTEFWLVTYLDEAGQRKEVRCSTGLWGFQVLDETHPAAGTRPRVGRGARGFPPPP